MSHDWEDRQKALEYECWCGAAEGQRCTTVSGAPTLHAHRADLGRQAARKERLTQLSETGVSADELVKVYGTRDADGSKSWQFKFADGQDIRMDDGHVQAIAAWWQAEGAERSRRAAAAVVLPGLSWAYI